MHFPPETSTRSGRLLAAVAGVATGLVLGGCSSLLPGLPAPDQSEREWNPAGEFERGDLRVEAESRPRAPTTADDAPWSGASGALTVGVVSDLNGRYGSTEYGPDVQTTVDWLAHRLQPDVVISTGDHVAGQKRGLDYGAMWSAFHGAVTRPLAEAGIPFAPTPGNHDASAAARFEPERRRYVREWRDRRPNVTFVGEGEFPLYYAFEVGPALFISLDVTVPGPLPDSQMQWLASVLRSFEEKPAKIVFAHLPLVPFAKGREDEIIGAPAFEGLLREYGVDAMLSGHHHAYYPGRRSGIKMIGMACLGGGSRELIGTERKSRKSAVAMRIEHDGTIRVRARYGSNMQRRIDRRELPRRIQHGGWTVRRLGTRPRVVSAP